MGGAELLLPVGRQPWGEFRRVIGLAGPFGSGVV